MQNLSRRSRLELRLTPDEKALIDRAAALNGSNTTDFVRATMLAAARDTVQVHEVIRLTTEGSRQFVEALLEPPEPNKNLQALIREFQPDVLP